MRSSLTPAVSASIPQAAQLPLVASKISKLRVILVQGHVVNEFDFQDFNFLLGLTVVACFTSVRLNVGHLKFLKLCIIVS
jgi:hypothetical protein